MVGEVISRVIGDSRFLDAIVVAVMANMSIGNGWGSNTFYKHVHGLHSIITLLAIPSRLNPSSIVKRARAHSSLHDMPIHKEIGKHRVENNRKRREKVLQASSLCLIQRARTK